MSNTVSVNELGLEIGTWQFDPAHSTIGFEVRHLMVSKVRGVFEKFTGTITVAENLLDSVVNAEIEANSINTKDKTRDEHLNSNDFLDAPRFPTLKFKSTSIETSGDSYLLHGELTIRDITKHVSWQMEFNGTANDPWGGRRSGFTARLEINRKDYGIDFNIPLDGGGFVVGDKVKLEIDVEAILQK